MENQVCAHYIKVIKVWLPVLGIVINNMFLKYIKKNILLFFIYVYIVYNYEKIPKWIVLLGFVNFTLHLFAEK